MDKQVAGRLAETHLDEWQRNVTYAELAYADDNSSVTKRDVTAEGIIYTVEKVVWREQGQRAYTMSVRVSVAGRRSLFGKAVSRHGRMYPDGRYVDGA